MHDEEPPQPPQSPPRPQRGRGALGTIAAAVAVGATKFALVAKLLLPSWTFILSLALYVGFFGWRIGIVLIFVLAAHELGHYYAYRAYGLPARLPVFVPFLGAYTAGAIAPELESDAYIALAGPLVGLGLAAACYGIGTLTHDAFWFAAADISAFLNLFNMLPMLPFDGGRIIGAVWPPLWIAGIALFVAAALWLHVPIVLVAIIAILGFPAMFSSMRGRVDPRAAAMTLGARIRVGTWYAVVLVGLAVILGQAQQALPAQGTL